MTINTHYDIGDFIWHEGKRYKIISIHLYEGEQTHTERYYVGNGKWITLKFEKGTKEE